MTFGERKLCNESTGMDLDLSKTNYYSKTILHDLANRALSFSFAIVVVGVLSPFVVFIVAGGGGRDEGQLGVEIGCGWPPLTLLC